MKNKDRIFVTKIVKDYTAADQAFPAGLQPLPANRRRAGLSCALHTRPVAGQALPGQVLPSLRPDWPFLRNIHPFL